MLRGVEPILYDMMDRPEFLHQIIAGYTANQDSLMTQLEELGLLEDELTELHCTPCLYRRPPLRPVPESPSG